MTVLQHTYTNSQLTKWTHQEMQIHCSKWNEENSWQYHVPAYHELQMSTISSKAMSPIWNALIGECDSHFLIWNDYSLHTVYCCRYLVAWLTTHSQAHCTDKHTQRHVPTAVCLRCAISSFSVSSAVRTFNYKSRHTVHTHTWIDYTIHTFNYAQYNISTVTLYTYVQPYYIHKLWVVCTHYIH